MVYNTGNAGTDAWDLDNIATITALPSPYSLLSFNNAGFSSGNDAFPVASPQQRFHIVDSPVVLLCDTTTGTLRRYENYPITSAQSSVDSHAELNALSADNALLGSKLSACDFDYDPGTPTRSGLLNVTLTLTETQYSGHNESITLFKQVHVSNVP